MTNLAQKFKEPSRPCLVLLTLVFLGFLFFGVAMSKDPAFLFYPGDYLRDTQCLSEKAQVAYDRIICEHMRNICIRQQQLNFFTKRLSEEEKEELMMVLTKIGGGYCVDWVVASIEKRRAYSESRKQNRAGKTKEHMLTYDLHMENEIEIEKESTSEIEITNKNNLPKNFVLDVINYLNEKLGSSFKPTSKNTIQHIRARYNEGYRIEDFKKVIDIKHNKWHDDPKMVDFLRPQTLFGTKFEAYLNEKNNSDEHDPEKFEKLKEKLRRMNEV